MTRPSLRLALTGALVAAAALTVTGAALAGPDARPPGYVAVQQPAPGDTPAPPERDCPPDKGAREDRGPAPQPAPTQPPAAPAGADL